MFATCSCSNVGRRRVNAACETLAQTMLTRARASELVTTATHRRSESQLQLTLCNAGSANMLRIAHSFIACKPFVEATHRRRHPLHKSRKSNKTLCCNRRNCGDLSCSHLYQLLHNQRATPSSLQECALLCLCTWRDVKRLNNSPASISASKLILQLPPALPAALRNTIGNHLCVLVHVHLNDSFVAVHASHLAHLHAVAVSQFFHYRYNMTACCVYWVGCTCQHCNNTPFRCGPVHEAGNSHVQHHIERVRYT